jgi:WD40 repeat protein
MGMPSPELLKIMGQGEEGENQVESSKPLYVGSRNPMRHTLMKLFPLRHSIRIASMAVCFSMPFSSWARPLQVLNRPSHEQVFSLAFSPNGQMRAVGSTAPATLPGNIPGSQRLPEGTIELWDLRSGKLTRTLGQSAWTENGDDANRVATISFSPDGKWVVGSDMQGYALWDLAAGKEQFRWFSGLAYPDLSVGWSSDGRELALPSMEQARFALTNGIAVIEMATGKRTAFFPVEIGYARTARISPDGRLLATAGHDCTVRVFDFGARTNIFSEFAETTMYAACFSPDGRYLVAGSGWGGVLLIHEITDEGGKIKITKKGKSSPGAGELHHMEFTPDGKRAFSSSYGAVGLWDATTWTAHQSLSECYGRLSPDGTRVALVRDRAPDIIEIWDLEELAKTMPKDPH